MKPFKQLLMLFCLTALVMSCNDDDDNPPDPVNEEEVITTLRLSLTPTGGQAITLISQDLDGDGPDAPVLTVPNLPANTSFTGTVQVLNETESPAEDITEEVEQEDDEHQFFYDASGSLAFGDYSDMDDDGNPVGISFTMTTSDAGQATLTATLRHEPKKPNDGSLADAGGETDIAVTFNITVN